MRTLVSVSAAILASRLQPARAMAQVARISQEARTRIQNAFTAGLVADALALGGHYECT